MNILINLKSQIIGEALADLIKKDEAEEYFIVVDGEGRAPNYDVNVIIVDHKSLTHELLTRWPKAKLVLLDTGLSQEELITLFLMYNLDAVLSTDENAALMKKALKLVTEGQIWISNNNLKALLHKVGTISREDKVGTISKREHEILDQITQGKKNKEIAAQLFMSEQTVKAHLSRIFKKFNVSSRAQLISLLMHENH